MMSINRKLRLTITASVVALTAAAPAAFAQPQDADGIYRGSYTDPIGTPNVPPMRYTEPATDAGGIYRGSYSDPIGTPNVPPARYTEPAMEDRLTALGSVPETGVTYYYNPSWQFVIPLQPPGVPNY